MTGAEQADPPDLRLLGPVPIGSVRRFRAATTGSTPWARVTRRAFPAFPRYRGTYLHASFPAGPGLTPAGRDLFLRDAADRPRLWRAIWAVLSDRCVRLTDRCQNAAPEPGQSQKVTPASRPCGRIADSGRVPADWVVVARAARSASSGRPQPSGDRPHFAVGNDGQCQPVWAFGCSSSPSWQAGWRAVCHGRRSAYMAAPLLPGRNA